MYEFCVCVYVLIWVCVFGVGLVQSLVVSIICDLFSGSRVVLCSS